MSANTRRPAGKWLGCKTPRAVEIPISLTLDELKWLPGLSPDTLRAASDDPGAALAQLPPATVQWRGETRTYTWQGRVKRWEAGLDARTRTLDAGRRGRGALEAISTRRTGPRCSRACFAGVSIVARRVPGAIVIPRVALQPQQTVFCRRQ